MSLELNTKLGHYHVIRPLGEGGMGTVYLASDTRLDRKVALKTIAMPESGFETLQAEAKILASVNHANVLSLYDVFEHEDHYVLVTEYLPNQTLADALASAPMALDEALDTAIALARGLEAIHQQRIIHCDLKPSNVLLGFDRTVKIGDFGIALTGQVNDDRTDQVKGTLAAISPELLCGEPATPSSDIYSLGLIYYQLFTGKPPYDEFHDDDAVREAILKGKIPRPTCPIKEVNQLLDEMLQTSPKARINSACDVAQRLQQVRQKRTLSELTGTINAAHSKKFPKWASLSLSAVLCIGVLVGFNAYISEPPPTKRLGVLVDQVVTNGFDEV
ncbi:MAG: serine/threonine protein kinase, partial [Gammaproteobacteria bacterium]|nr:serine/threonine protein kinase [Gammaproteobacteria bacterium]